MKKDKGPRFTLTGKIITDRDGLQGEAYLDGQSWRVRLLVAKPTEAQLKVANRMQSWYYNSYVKGNISQ